MLELSTTDVFALGNFRRAIKIAPVKIRPFTEKDVLESGPSFLDLEDRIQHVEIGRYLCVGTQGEKWTCGEKSLQARKAISEPDEEGFRFYVQRFPQAIFALLIDEPFHLILSNEDNWKSQAGVITWNGLTEEKMILRVIEKEIFFMTYQFLQEE